MTIKELMLSEIALVLAIHRAVKIFAIVSPLDQLLFILITAVALPCAL